MAGGDDPRKMAGGDDGFGGSRDLGRLNRTASLRPGKAGLRPGQTGLRPGQTGLRPGQTGLLARRQVGRLCPAARGSCARRPSLSRSVTARPGQTRRGRCSRVLSHW